MNEPREADNAFADTEVESERAQEAASAAAHVLGEDAPHWMPLGFALVGAAVAAAAAWLWLSPRAAPQPQAATTTAATAATAATAPMPRKAAAAPPSAVPGPCPIPTVVSFAFDSAAPSRTELAAAREPVLALLREQPQATVVIQGYANSTGSDQHNLLLSYQRAKAVAADLAAAGVPPGRIVLRAAGSHEPIAGLAPAAERNRRVTLEVRGLRGCP